MWIDQFIGPTPSSHNALLCRDSLLPAHQSAHFEVRVISPRVYIRRFVFICIIQLFVCSFGWLVFYHRSSICPSPPPTPRHDNAFVYRKQRRNKALSSFHAAKHLYICMLSTLQSFVEATGRVFGREAFYNCILFYKSLPRFPQPRALMRPVPVHLHLYRRIAEVEEANGSSSRQDNRSNRP